MATNAVPAPSAASVTFPVGGCAPSRQQHPVSGPAAAAVSAASARADSALLGEKPFNGYGLIKEIAERSGGTWTPSPGSVYPTLQQLVDEELIEAVGEGRRTEFVLTDDGRAYVDSHTEELARVWAIVTERTDADAGLHDSIAKLMGVVHQFRFAATDEQRAKAVAQLDETRRALYGILAD
jgi:DNA-binding PadR family transcriptional regulator